MGAFLTLALSSNQFMSLDAIFLLMIYKWGLNLTSLGLIFYIFCVSQAQAHYGFGEVTSCLSMYYFDRFMSLYELPVSDYIFVFFKDSSLSSFESDLLSLS